MKIFGSGGFERSYTLVGTAGQHDPHVMAATVSRMVPREVLTYFSVGQFVCDAVS